MSNKPNYVIKLSIKEAPLPIWNVQGILDAIPDYGTSWSDLLLRVTGLPDELVAYGLAMALRNCASHKIGNGNLDTYKSRDGKLQLNVPSVLKDGCAYLSLLCAPEVTAQALYILSDKRLLGAYLPLLGKDEVRTMLDKVTMGVSRVITGYAGCADKVLPLPEGVLQKAADNAASLQHSLLELVLAAKSHGGADQAASVAEDTMPMFMHLAFSLSFLGTVLVHTAEDKNAPPSNRGMKYKTYLFKGDGYDKSLDDMQFRLSATAAALRNAVKGGIL